MERGENDNERYHGTGRGYPRETCRRKKRLECRTALHIDMFAIDSVQVFAVPPGNGIREDQNPLANPHVINAEVMMEFFGRLSPSQMKAATRTLKCANIRNLWKTLMALWKIQLRS